MLWFKDIPLPIPFYIDDPSGDDVLSGANAVATIRRISDNKYFNSFTGLWQDASYDISMSHYYKGIWTYSFTPTEIGSYLIKCDSNNYLRRDGFLVYVTDKFDNLDTIPTISDGVDSIIGNVSGIPTIDSNVDSIITKLDTNLDTTVSSRLANADYIAMSGEDIETIEGKVDLINSKLDEHLDVAVSTRSSHTPEDIRDILSIGNEGGVGEFSLVINITVDGVIASDVEVYVYDDERTAICSAVSDSNGQVVFYLDANSYFVDFTKNGLWQKEISQTVSADTEIDVDMESIVTDGFLGIEFRELNPGLILEVGITVNLGIELYSTIGKTFSVSSGTCKVNDGESISCSVDGYKVYAMIPISESGWNYIVFSVVVGSETVKYEKKCWVD